MVYFDNAATTFPKPVCVREAVLSAMERYGANPGRSGHKLSMNTAVRIFEAREAVRGVFNAKAVEDVAFTSNCTHAINLALKGLLKQGDHVIISDLEHNAVLRPVHTLSRRGFISYSIAEIDEFDEEKTIDSFSSKIKPNTRLIATTHCSNVWGVCTPVGLLGALCRQRGVKFLVDAAQSAGVLQLDTRKLGIDFLCMPGHKSLYGPSGTGVLITPHGSELETLLEGGTGSMSADYNQPKDMPERLECGTLNTVGIIGLGAGLKYVRNAGVERIYDEEFEVASYLYAGLRNIRRARLYTRGYVKGKHLPVISFNLEGINSEEVTSSLSDMGFAVRGGLHCAPLAHRKMGTLETGAVRLSVGMFNTLQQARQFLSAVNRIK